MSKFLILISSLAMGSMAAAAGPQNTPAQNTSAQKTQMGRPGQLLPGHPPVGQQPPQMGQPGQGPQGKRGGPGQACAALKDACMKAGFKPGAHQGGKGLKVDCMDKIGAGQTVPGVAMTPNDPAVAQCKAAFMAKGHGGRGGEKGQGHRPPPNGPRGPGMGNQAPVHSPATATPKSAPGQ